ncbi:MAG: hypothetical protein P8J27_01490 [Mariniblastus sp.]|nr:hypothetical protein [Mariniblastus sp.]
MINLNTVKKRVASKLIIALSCSFLLCVSGCSKPTSSEPKSSSAPDATKPQLQDQVASISPQLLTGVWLGQASLDVEKLERKIENLPPQQQQVVAAKANSFLSTVMAMDFRSDGTVENEIEIISIDGQSLRDGSVGQWKVLDSTAEGLMVETEEQLDNGTVAKDKMFYRFFDNGNQVAIAARVSEDLAGCDTVIVFERRTPTPTNVAAGDAKTQTK